MAKLRGPEGSINSALRLAEKSGIRKGMAGNKNWFYVGTGLWTLRTVRRLAARQQQVLISEKLQPGQRLIIANGRATLDEDQPAAVPSGKGSKRAKKKQARRQAKASRRAGDSAAS